MSEFAPTMKLLKMVDRLEEFRAGYWQEPPALVEIAPTNTCNAKCPWCFYAGTHSAESLDRDAVMFLVNDLADIEVPAISWTGGGDPSVYPHVNEAVELAARRGLKQGMFTNGYKPIERPELLEWVRLTVTDRETIPQSASRYATATKTGVVVNQTADMPRETLMRLCREAREAGVHYFQVRPALSGDWQTQEEVPFPEYLRTEARDGFRVQLTEYKWQEYRQPHGYPLCHGHRFVPFIWYDGDVAVCAYHHGKPEYTLGNLRDGGFGGVWWSQRRREMIEAGIPVIPACQNCCKNHEINKALAVVAGDVPGPADGEFL